MLEFYNSLLMFQNKYNLLDSVYERIYNYGLNVYLYLFSIYKKNLMIN